MARLPSEQAMAGGPGSSKRVKSGLYVKAPAGLKIRDKRVERLARRVRAVLPWLESSDFPTVKAWAELETLASYVYGWLYKTGIVNESGKARRLLDEYRKLRIAQTVLARELGMTPASRIAIKAHSAETAVDIAAQCMIDAAEEERARQNGQANVGEAEDAEAMDEPQDGRSLPQSDADLSNAGKAKRIAEVRAKLERSDFMKSVERTIQKAEKHAQQLKQQANRKPSPPGPRVRSKRRSLSPRRAAPSATACRRWPTGIAMKSNGAAPN